MKNCEANHYFMQGIGTKLKKVEEYIYENGMQVRRIVNRTITTTTIEKEDQGIEPVEVTFPVALSEDESPEDARRC